jgi:membrane-bound serine protease (ClpP class)
MKVLIRNVILLIFCVLQVSAVFSQDTLKNNKIFLFDIKEMIAPPVWYNTKKAFEEARSAGVDVVVIKMNTYGGMLDAADSIRTAILNSNIPVYVFIDKNAASAGALISIACDSIYMAPGSSIGAATVVDAQGKVLPDKYQSYMRSMMRATAEAKGRDPEIAQAMVDPSIYIPGISDSGKVLTFTVKEAIKNGFCQAEVKTVNQLLEHAGINNYTIQEQQLTTADKIIKMLINPFVSGILIMIIIGGIYFELQTPGIGFPLAAAVVAALLYFAPLYLEGLASHWEILLFVLGLILLALEIFAVPGFGVLGYSGIMLIVVGLTLSLVGSTGPGTFDIDYTAIVKSFLLVIIAMSLGILVSIFLAKKLLETPKFKFALI